MHLNSKDQLFGQPILKIRAVVRDAMSESLSDFDKSTITDKVAKSLKKNRTAAEEVIESLIGNDYLVWEQKKDEGEVLHQLKTTAKGHRFGVAPANPPLSREKADTLLKEVIERAKKINASAKYVYRVQHLKVFGSYLSEKAVLGDLDVAVKIVPKYSGDAFTEANFKRIAAAKRKGRAFRSVLDEIFWPYQEVLMELKTKKKGLSLHEEDADEVVALTKTKTVYAFEA